MKLLIIITTSFLLFACSNLAPEIKNRDMNVQIFGGEGESIKIFCNGVLKVDEHIPRADKYGVSMFFTMPRSKEKMQLAIQRRGVTSTFTINPQHFGDIAISLDIYGGVRIEDGTKMPPRDAG